MLTPSIDLALVYKCDPFIFLDRPTQEIAELYLLTNARLKQQAGE